MNPKIKKTILFIEDEPNVQDIYKTKLGQGGYKVIIANSGITGFDLAIKKKPDLILLDLILPLKEGFVVLKELKDHPKTKSIPVIILSNLGQEYEKKMGKSLGADLYLSKTDVTPNEVLKIVKEFLGEQDTN